MEDKICIALSDSDVLFMDDITGDIKIDADAIPEDSRVDGKTVLIHFDEDKGEVSHRYSIDMPKTTEHEIYLKWEQQEITNALNEAGKDPFKRFERGLARSYKKLAKEDTKILKHAEKLLHREVGPAGRTWKVHLQARNGKWAQTGKSPEELKSLYANGMERPELLNAIVVDEDGKFVRRGMEDMIDANVRWTDATAKITPGYAVKWSDPDELDLPKDSVNAEEPEKTTGVEQSASEIATQDNTIKDASNASADATAAEEKPTETTDAASKDAPPAPVGLTDKLVKRFTEVAIITGLIVLGPDGKPLSHNKIRKIKKDTIANYKVRVNKRDFSAAAWLEKANKKGIIKESMYNENLLVESPRIMLDADDTFLPSDINFKDKVKQAVAKEAEEKRIADLTARGEALKPIGEKCFADAQKAKAQSNHSGDVLEVIFNYLVPTEGAALTVAGEIARAMMRILYRDHNDGDKFFEGYGIETCGSSAEYLYDIGFAKTIQNILDDAHRLADDDDRYTDAINDLCEEVVDYLLSNPDLMWTISEVDSRDYSSEYIAENQPTYEFEIQAPYDVERLLDNGVVTAWDLNSYVEEKMSWESVYNGAEVERPWSTRSSNVSITNLTRDAYDQLEDTFRNNEEGYWEDFLAEYADELADDVDDDYDIQEDED